MRRRCDCGLPDGVFHGTPGAPFFFKLKAPRNAIGGFVQAVFFPPEQWIPQPTDWAVRNLRYKRYDLTTGEGARIWSACLALAAEFAFRQDLPMVREESARYGEAVLVKPRLGQGAFRVAVTDAYGRAVR